MVATYKGPARAKESLEKVANRLRFRRFSTVQLLIALALFRLTPGGAFSFNTNAGEHSMNGFNGFYFSFITLSTVGYGDITPVSRIARWLAAMEAMTGLLYVAVLIARLVSLYSAPKSNDSCSDV